MSYFLAKKKKKCFIGKKTPALRCQKIKLIPKRHSAFLFPSAVYSTKDTNQKEFIELWTVTTEESQTHFIC